MKVSDIVEKLGLEVFSGQDGLDKGIHGGYSSDLLSDVMGHAECGDVWTTLQTHKNVIAIASLKELAAVIVVKGYKPEPDTIKQSNEEGIPILGTIKDTFEINGLLFNLLKK
jgi:predicted transcriptional regulator